LNSGEQEVKRTVCQEDMMSGGYGGQDVRRKESEKVRDQEV